MKCSDRGLSCATTRVSGPRGNLNGLGMGSRQKPRIADFRPFWGVAWVLTVACGPFGAEVGGLLGCGGHQVGVIGAVLGKRGDGRLYIRDVPEGMGAAQAGLEPGDEIIAIDGRAVFSMTPEEVSKALRGDIGTTALLTIDHHGARRVVKVERQALRPPAPAPPPSAEEPPSPTPAEPKTP